MKIAVTYEDGQVFQHFGHTAQFKVYEAKDGKILSSQVVDTNGSGHGALAGFLSAQGVDTLICGGIGGGAQAALAEADIRLLGGVQGSADAAVEAFPVRLAGSMTRMSSAATMSTTAQGTTALRTAITPAAATATADPCPGRKNAAGCAACRPAGSSARAAWAARERRSHSAWMNTRPSA